MCQKYIQLIIFYPNYSVNGLVLLLPVQHAEAQMFCNNQDPAPENLKLIQKEFNCYLCYRISQM